MFEGKYATREDIDAAMRFGCGYPMGPLALLDLIGLDTAYEILDTMYKQGRDRLHAPAPILKQMVTAGMLGRKTGRGFYTYDGPDSPVRRRRPDPVGRRRAAAAAPHRQRRGRRHRHHGAGIVEVFAKAGFDVLYVGRSRTRSTGCARHHGASTRRSSAAGAPRTTRPRCSAGSPAPPRSTTSRTSTSWSRRSPRTSRSRRRCSRTSTTSASPARSWPRPPPRCR